jgi:hypothetical protein
MEDRSTVLCSSCASGQKLQVLGPLVVYWVSDTGKRRQALYVDTAHLCLPCCSGNPEQRNEEMPFHVTTIAARTNEIQSTPRKPSRRLTPNLCNGWKVFRIRRVPAL